MSAYLVFQVSQIEEPRRPRCRAFGSTAAVTDATPSLSLFPSLPPPSIPAMAPKSSKSSKIASKSPLRTLDRWFGKILPKKKDVNTVNDATASASSSHPTLKPELAHASSSLTSKYAIYVVPFGWTLTGISEKITYPLTFRRRLLLTRQLG